MIAKDINSVEFHLPEPIAVLELTMTDGAIVRVRQHGNVAGPRLILSHGNGFAIDAYFPFWRHFLADCEVFVFDQRSHGWNPRHDGGHTQQQMADDMQTLLRAIEARFGARQSAGIFHSLSATVSLLHSMRFGFQWDALILVDPPLTPPLDHPLHSLARDFELALGGWARQRRQVFPSVHELSSYFTGTRRMRRWVPGAAELMARSITRAASNGGIELVCPPEFEADIYVQNSNSPAWSALAAIAKDLFVLSSDYDEPDADPPGRVSKALSAEFGIEGAPVRNTGHLLQIERPEEAARIVQQHLRVCGFEFAPRATRRVTRGRPRARDYCSDSG
jgi:pimeloyl-ACP methyl ester carboxylesterase